MLKPAMNISELSMTERETLRSSALRASTVEPETSDTYPGTRGSTQGDKNDRMPATNAAIGKGRDDITPIL
jgi:hypothetical protein